MGIAYTQYSQYSNTTITVSTSSELNAAVAKLAGASGGTIQVDPNGGPYDLNISGVGSAGSPVLIEPLGGGTPQFTSMSMNNVDHIAITGMSLDSSGISGRGLYDFDLSVQNSDHVEIVGNSFTGNAQGMLTETGGGVRGVNGARIYDNSNVLISDNLFTNYFNAIMVSDATNMVFDGNELTQFQGDGFHAGGMVNSEVTNNYIHDPLGSTNLVAHTDLIQIFQNVQMDLMTSGLDISGNLLDTGTGTAAQGIHISNSLFGTGSKNDGWFHDISISDNVVHTAMVRGIGVNNVQGLDVTNNTVLWNEASPEYKSVTAAPTYYVPQILAYGTNVTVDGNIAYKVSVNGNTASGNYEIDYKNGGAANYVDNHITDLDGSSNGGVPDLSILKSSALYGTYGASMSSDGVTLSSYSGSGGSSGGSTSGGTVAIVTDPTVVYGDTDTTSAGGTTADTSSSTGGETTAGAAGETGGTDPAPDDTTSGDTTDSAAADPVMLDATASGASGAVGDTAGSTDGATGGSSGGDTGSTDGETAGTGADTTASGDTSGDTVGGDTSATPDTTSSDTGSGKGHGGDHAPGQVKKVYKATTADDGGNILTQILNAILGVFGGGSSADGTDSSAHTAGTIDDTSHDATETVTLESVVPVTGWLDETDVAPDDEEEDPIVHLAA